MQKAKEENCWIMMLSPLRNFLGSWAKVSPKRGKGANGFHLLVLNY
jgi:hypothetical protein